VRSRTRTQINAFRLGAELLAFGGDLLECTYATGRNDKITTGAGQHLRGQCTERAGRAGDNRRLALDVEQRQWIFQKIFRH